MEEVKRKVKIRTIVPIHGVIKGTPLTGFIREISLTTEQIRKCIVQKGVVTEILPDGQTKLLTLSNYDKIEKVEVPEEPVQVVVEPKNNEVTEDTETIVPEDTKEDVQEPVIETVEVTEPSEEVAPIVETVSIPTDEVEPENNVEEENTDNQVEEQPKENFKNSKKKHRK